MDDLEKSGKAFNSVEVQLSLPLVSLWYPFNDWLNFAGVMWGSGGMDIACARSPASNTWMCVWYSPNSTSRNAHMLLPGEFPGKKSMGSHKQKSLGSPVDKNIWVTSQGKHAMM